MFEVDMHDMGVLLRLANAKYESWKDQCTIQRIKIDYLEAKIEELEGNPRESKKPVSQSFIHLKRNTYLFLVNKKVNPRTARVYVNKCKTKADIIALEKRYQYLVIWKVV